MFLKPNEGNYSVYSSYGTLPCPTIPLNNSCCKKSQR